MATRTLVEVCGGELDRSEFMEITRSNLHEFARQAYDEAEEAGELYPPDTIWLAVDHEGFVIGEVLAPIHIMAGFQAAYLWPPRPGEKLLVIRKTDFQAERN